MGGGIISAAENLMAGCVVCCEQAHALAPSHPGGAMCSIARAFVRALTRETTVAGVPGPGAYEFDKAPTQPGAVPILLSNKRSGMHASQEAAQRVLSLAHSRLSRDQCRPLPFRKVGETAPNAYLSASCIARTPANLFQVRPGKSLPFASCLQG
jgi:hypothetical protein